jgi:acetyl esterase/lipase
MKKKHLNLALKLTLSFLALLLSGIGIFLSSWIVIPASNMQVLILAVGAPEISPWLLILNIIAFSSVFYFVPQRQLKRIACIGSFIGFLICAWVIINIPPTHAKMTVAMEQGLGADYLKKIPQSAKVKMRSSSFILADAFTGIHLEKTRHQSDIRFATPSGIPLTMEVYQPLQPPQLGKYPTLVVIYGGAWRTGDPKDNLQFNQYMASRGYTVFAIDYRHAPQHRFPAQLEDVKTSLNFIKTHADEYEADPNNMVLLGRSAGAHLAMLAAYQPDAPPIRAVVSYYGPVNLTNGYNFPPNPDPINSRAVLKAFLGGSPQELAELYKTASPINYVRSNLPPTLLIYGGRDNLVQAKYGRNMYQSLYKSGNTTVFLEIPWAEHAFDAVFNGVSNQLALYNTERFLAWSLFQNE